MSEDPHFKTIETMSTAHVLSRCLHVTAALGVADVLGDEPETVQVLAGRVGASPRGLRSLMRALAAEGIFADVGGQFSHTPASLMLRDDHPRSMRSYVRWMGAAFQWDAYGELEQSVRAGKPAAANRPRGLFGVLEQDPELGRLFDETMTAKSHEKIAAILDAYDFGGASEVCDLGGGNGHLLQGILQRYGAVKGVLFDLPRVIEKAVSTASNRLALVGGDFFTDPLPAADLYLMMNVLHDWEDADAHALLERVRRAARPHARILAIEAIVPETARPHPANLMDVGMLALVGSFERTEGEYARLLRGAGFSVNALIETDSDISILEAIAA